MRLTDTPASALTFLGLLVLLAPLSAGGQALPEGVPEGVRRFVGDSDGVSEGVRRFVGGPAPRAPDAPLALHLLPRLAEAPPRETASALREAPPPASPAQWAVHGGMALVPLGAVYGASRVGGERLWVTAAEATAGSVAGSLPARLLFLHPPGAGGRWTELDVAAFGAGLVLTPPVAALGTWGLGELAFHGSQERGRAYLGALGGAAAGTLLAMAVHGFLERVVDDPATLEWMRRLIGLGIIGSGATLGYQWGGGGPRTRER
jgi:hypothetical protein